MSNLAQKKLMDLTDESQFFYQKNYQTMCETEWLECLLTFKPQMVPYV